MVNDAKQKRIDELTQQIGKLDERIAELNEKISKIEELHEDFRKQKRARTTRRAYLRGQLNKLTQDDERMVEEYLKSAEQPPFVSEHQRHWMRNQDYFTSNDPKRNPRPSIAQIHYLQNFQPPVGAKHREEYFKIVGTKLSRAVTAMNDAFLEVAEDLQKARARWKQK